MIALSAMTPAPARDASNVSVEPRVVHVDERLAVIDKPAGLVVHPAPGHRGGTLVDALGDAARRRRGRAARDRPPARPGHLGPDDRRPRRRGPPPLIGDDQGARGRAQLPRADRGASALALGHDRRAARARSPRPREARGARPWRPRGAHPLHRRRGRWPPTPWSRHGWRPGAPTRSAPTSPRSAIRSPATRATATPGASGSSGSSSTAPGCAFAQPFSGERLEFESPLPADLTAALERARS